VKGYYNFDAVVNRWSSTVKTFLATEDLAVVSGVWSVVRIKKKKKATEVSEDTEKSKLKVKS